MSEKALEVWTLNFSDSQAREIEKALKEDGYPVSNEGLRDWVLDCVKFRGPDIVARAQRWMKENPGRVDAAKGLLSTVMRNLPGMLRGMKQGPPR